MNPNSENKLAIYAGTFDPITYGHLDILSRSIALFDRVIVAVAENPQKKPLFSPHERRDLIAGALPDAKNVEVDIFSGLLMNYARKRRATCIVRGLRAMADFEYEFQLAHVNRNIAPEIETVFLMTDKQMFYVSSSMVKEVAQWGGNVDQHVPRNVAQALRDRLVSRTTAPAR